ncbi:hypothetical protein HDV00_007552 [Rhizophlyctis rosea]|nr:hypothetical protein HDV00_007552 [Rhizophlyctis rosea]
MTKGLPKVAKGRSSPKGRVVDKGKGKGEGGGAGVRGGGGGGSGSGHEAGPSAGGIANCAGPSAGGIADAGDVVEKGSGDHERKKGKGSADVEGLFVDEGGPGGNNNEGGEAPGEGEGGQEVLLDSLSFAREITDEWPECQYAKEVFDYRKEYPDETGAPVAITASGFVERIGVWVKRWEFPFGMDRTAAEVEQPSFRGPRMELLIAPELPDNIFVKTVGRNGRFVGEKVYELELELEAGGDIEDVGLHQVVQGLIGVAEGLQQHGILHGDHKLANLTFVKKTEGQGRINANQVRAIDLGGGLFTDGLLDGGIEDTASHASLTLLNSPDALSATTTTDMLSVKHTIWQILFVLQLCPHFQPHEHNDITRSQAIKRHLDMRDGKHALELNIDMPLEVAPYYLELAGDVLMQTEDEWGRLREWNKPPLSFWNHKTGTEKHSKWIFVGNRFISEEDARAAEAAPAAAAAPAARNPAAAAAAAPAARNPAAPARPAAQGPGAQDAGAQDAGAQDAGAPAQQAARALPVMMRRPRRRQRDELPSLDEEATTRTIYVRPDFDEGKREMGVKIWEIRGDPEVQEEVKAELGSIVKDKTDGFDTIVIKLVGSTGRGAKATVITTFHRCVPKKTKEGDNRWAWVSRPTEATAMLKSVGISGTVNGVSITDFHIPAGSDLEKHVPKKGSGKRFPVVPVPMVIGFLNKAIEITGSTLEDQQNKPARKR